MFTNASSDMYQSCVKALLDDVSNSSSETSADRTPVHASSCTSAKTVSDTPAHTSSSSHGVTNRCTSSCNTSRTSSPLGYTVPTRHPRVKYVDEKLISTCPPSFQFVPRVGRYAHVLIDYQGIDESLTQIKCVISEQFRSA